MALGEVPSGNASLQDTETSVLVDFERLGLLGSPPWTLVASVCMGFVCFVFASLLALGLS